MSAYATLCRPDAGYLWTDGAIYDADTRLVQVSRKAHPVAGKPLVVTGRGGTALPILFAELLASEDLTIDALATEGEAITGRFLDEHAGYIASLEEAGAMIDPQRRQASDLVVIGWSERLVAPLVVLRTTWPEEDGILFKIGEQFSAPAISAKAGRRLAMRLGGASSASEVHPRAYGLALFDTMRKTPGDAALGYEGVYAVGGHVLETVVTAEGVSQRIIQTWPDKIGEWIDPRADSMLKTASLR
ncbi:hypothetical protein [Fulvimarina sp. MAC3]|uniref:hypothetical protein n=1 Tax=Fulvimarina sp. MAC3 TaxID=3148887 RepID=UPI0031FC58B0